MSPAPDAPIASPSPSQREQENCERAGDTQPVVVSSSLASAMARFETKILWFVIYFVSTEGGGFRTNSWGGLGSSELGWFGAMQLLVAAISVVAVIPGFNELVRWCRTGVGVLVLAVGLIPLYLGVTTLLRAVTGSGAGISDIFGSLVQLKFFLMVYLFAVLLSKPNGLRDALRMMSIYALAAAVSIIIIVAFKIHSDVALVLTSTDITRAFRVIFPAALLVGTGWMLFLSQYVVSGRLADLGASLICLSATVMQLHRGTLIAVGATVLLFVLWIMGSFRIVSGARVWRAIGFFAALGIGVAYYVLHSGVALAYLLASGSELIGLSADFLHRIMLILNSWNYVVSSTFGLGVGLKWEHVDDFWTYLNTAFVAGPTFDSSYANIIIVLGIPGVALFLWLYIRLAGMSKMLRGSHSDPFARMFGFFIGAFVIFSALVGLTTDFALISDGASVFVLVLVMASRMQYLLRKGEISE